MPHFANMDAYLRMIDGLLARVDATARRRPGRGRPDAGPMVSAVPPSDPRPLEGGAAVDPADPLT